jgi:hypothetical protein
MIPVAATTTVDSEAANLAGPAADPRGWSQRRIANRGHLAAWARSGRITEQQHLQARANMEDDDERHPYNVLTRWAMMIAEDYDHELPALNVSSAADYLGRHLAHIAQDADQDFPLMLAELRKCRRHLESVLSTVAVKQRGAPCPRCTDPDVGVGPRLLLTPGHWCDDEACTKVHYDTNEGDAWVCPRNTTHTWTEVGYRSWVEDRTLA